MHSCFTHTDPWGDLTKHSVSLGPISGLRGVAEDLIGHFEIDPAAHEGLLLEVEFAIGDSMIDTLRDILRERGIPIPAEAGALPMVNFGSNPAREE